MTINELIERLEDYREDLGGDAEVRLMTQQHWPFENTLAGLASLDEIRISAAEAGKADGDFDCEGDAEQVVYIVEGRQLGYGTPTAWNACC